MQSAPGRLSYKKAYVMQKLARDISACMKALAKKTTADQRYAISYWWLIVTVVVKTVVPEGLVKLCHMIYIWLNFIKQVQKLGGPPLR